MHLKMDYIEFSCGEFAASKRFSSKHLRGNVRIAAPINKPYTKQA